MSQTCNDAPSVFHLLPESLNDDGAKQDEESREDQRYNGHHLSPGGDKQTNLSVLPQRACNLVALKLEACFCLFKQTYQLYSV